MRQIKFISFGEFAPDSREVDAEQMALSIGLIPLHGDYRSMSKLVELSSITTPDPINGSHVHLVTPERSNDSASPTDDFKDNSLTDWVTYGDDDLAPEDAEGDEYWWRVAAPVVEATGVSLLVEDSLPPDNTVSFGIGELEDPNTDIGHFLRMRHKVQHSTALDGFSMSLGLYQGAVLIAQIFFDEEDYEGSGWQTEEYELLEAEAATITDYTSLHLELHGLIDYPTPVLPLPVEIVAVVNEYPEAWSKEPDSEASESATDDLSKIEILQDGDQGTYLYHESIGTKLFEALLADVVVPDNPAAPGTNWELFAWGVSPDVDSTIKIRLMELDEEISLVEGNVSAGEVPQEVTGTIPEADLLEIEDFTKLSLIVEMLAQQAGASLVLDPNSNRSPEINFTAKPSGQIWDKVSDDDDDTWAEATVDGQFGCNLTNPAETPAGGTNVTVKAKVAVTGRCKFKLRFGDTTNGDHFTWLSGYIQNDELTLSSGTNKPATVDWPNAYLRILTINTSTTATVKVIETWVETEGPSTEFEARISECGLLSPTETAGLHACFVEYDLPISKPVTPGDRAIVYAGNEPSIFEVSRTSGFQDVSKTENASYGDEVAPPTSWEFASWGNRVCAVNGSDPCQWQEAPGERFVDLMEAGGDPETEIFTARYCAVARDFMFLGNILHPTDPTVGEYTVWWSDINNPRLYLFVDPAHLSDYQTLVPTSGAITGMAGGEFITIAKRTSMYRGTFVGPPLIWDIQVASYEEGTMYGSSIVPIDRDLFFFGSGGFRHLPYGSGVRPIGDGKITKMFTDKIYEDRALNQFATDDVRLVQNAIVGTYDQWSRLVFWLYRGIADNEYQNRMALVYSPWDDHWSVLDLPLSNTAGRPPENVANSGYSHLNSLPTLPTDDKPVTRGVIGFGYTGTEATYERSLDTEHYDVHVQTKKLSSGSIAQAEGKVIKIHGIRFITSIDQAIGELNFKAPIISAVIVGAKDVHFTCDKVQETVVTGSDNQDDNGWLMFDNPLPGEFFVVDAQYEALELELIEELLGFELDVEVGSKK
jgi:hypothetical protein